jgi:hypothetical protein
MRWRNNFRQRDVTRAARAARMAGLEVDRIEIDTNNGKISVLIKNVPPIEVMSVRALNHAIESTDGGRKKRT